MLGKVQSVYDRMLLEITLQLTNKTNHTTQVLNTYSLPAKSWKDLSHQAPRPGGSLSHHSEHTVNTHQLAIWQITLLPPQHHLFVLPISLTVPHLPILFSPFLDTWHPSSQCVAIPPQPHGAFQLQHQLSSKSHIPAIVFVLWFIF